MAVFFPMGYSFPAAIGAALHQISSKEIICCASSMEANQPHTTRSQPHRGERREWKTWRVPRGESANLDCFLAGLLSHVWVSALLHQMAKASEKLLQHLAGQLTVKLESHFCIPLQKPNDKVLGQTRQLNLCAPRPTLSPFGRMYCIICFKLNFKE